MRFHISKPALHGQKERVCVKTRTTFGIVYPTLRRVMSQNREEPQAESSIIATRNKRQAMDWSLVLLSQGVESTVLEDPDSHQWGLSVDPHQLEEAQTSIERYEWENRAWPFRHPLPWPGFAFDWTVLAWVGLIAALFFLQSRPDATIEGAGICNAGLVRSGEGWRLLTATTLHGDIGHLAMNTVFGILLLGVAMGRFGSGLTLLATSICGFLANLVTMLWRHDHVSGLGASGVVMAALGLLAADATMQYWRRRQPPRLIAEGIAGGLMLFVLVGVSPTSDVAAHAIGFTTGFLIGLPLAALPLTWIRRPRWNLIAGGIYSVTLAGAWVWALTAQAASPRGF
jgi:membrane associated rhomboid family serine protease